METNSLPTAKKKQPKLHWYQWRLRSLFLLTLFVAIGISYVGVTIQNQRKQKAAAEEIRKVGGVPGCEPTWLGRLLRDDSLVRVESVALSGKSVNEATLVHLQELSQLRTLLLQGTKVTDGELVHLEGLSQLRRLWLNGTRITDAGLVHIQRLSQLHLLFLNDTEMTDTGLVHLQGLTQLQWLDLSNTKVTDEGVDYLRRALPHCIIHIHDQRTGATGD